MSKVTANMAGNLWKLHVKVGDIIEAGQEVAILESMKMEIPIESEVTGKIVEVRVSEGDFINEEDVLLVLESK